MPIGVGEITGTLSLDISKWKKPLQDALQPLENVQKRAQAATAPMEALATRLGNLTRAAQAFAVAIAGSQIVRFARDVAEAAFQAQAGGVIFEKMLQRVGESANRVQPQLQQLAQELRVAPQIIQQNAAELLRAGYQWDQIQQIYKGAAASALLVGKSTQQGVEIATAALTTGMSVYLNQIGIVQNLNTAYQAYAKQLGKTVDALTEAERAQAATQMVIKATAQEVQDMPTLFKGYGGAVAELSRAVYDLKIMLGETLLPAVTATTRGLTSLIGIVRDVMKNVSLFKDAIVGAFTGLPMQVTQSSNAFRVLASMAQTNAQNASALATEHEKIIAKFRDELALLDRYLPTLEALRDKTNLTEGESRQLHDAVSALAERFPWLDTAVSTTGETFKQYLSTLSAFRSDVQKMLGDILGGLAQVAALRLPELEQQREQLRRQLQATRQEALKLTQLQAVRDPFRMMDILREWGVQVKQGQNIFEVFATELKRRSQDSAKSIEELTKALGDTEAAIGRLKQAQQDFLTFQRTGQLPTPQTAEIARAAVTTGKARAFPVPEVLAQINASVAKTDMQFMGLLGQARDLRIMSAELPPELARTQGYAKLNVMALSAIVEGAAQYRDATEANAAIVRSIEVSTAQIPAALQQIQENILPMARLDKITDIPAARKQAALARSLAASTAAIPESMRRIQANTLSMGRLREVSIALAGVPPELQRINSYTQMDLQTMSRMLESLSGYDQQAKAQAALLRSIEISTAPLPEAMQRIRENTLSMAQLADIATLRPPAAAPPEEVMRQWANARMNLRALEDNLTGASEKAKAAAQAWASLKVAAIGAVPGLAGQMVQGALAMAPAGPWGMLAGALLPLITNSKTFAQIMEIINPLLQALANAVGAFLQPLIPLINVVATVLTPIFQALGTILGAVLLPVMQPLFYAFKYAGIVALYLARGVLWGVNKFIEGINLIIRGINWALGWLGVQIDEIATISLENFDEAIETLKNLTWEQASATKEATEATKEFAEQLTNVPTGYKVELLRYESMTPVPMQSGGLVTRPTYTLLGERGPEAVIPLRGEGASLGGTTVIVQFHGPVYGFDDFKQKVMRAVDEATVQRNVRTGGTVVTRAPMFAG